MEASYSARLSTHRHQAGFSLRQLGERLGISFSSLARIERGIGEPSPHTRLLLEQWMNPEGEHPKCNCAQCAVPRAHPFRVLEGRVAMLEQQVMALQKGTDHLMPFPVCEKGASMAESDEIPVPRCLTCGGRMPTPAHVFLHQQLHAQGGGTRLERGRLRQLPVVLYDHVARLMQAFHENMKT